MDYILKWNVFPLVSFGNNQKSYKIMRMNMFAVYDKAKPDKENIKA
jgi:hypothetical protein